MDTIPNKSECKNYVDNALQGATEVKILFDVDTILQRFPYKDTGEPVYIPIDQADKLVYMTTKQKTITSRGGAYINILSNIGNNIYWREDTFAANTGYYVQLYDFGPSMGIQLMDTPKLYLTDNLIPVPNPKNSQDVSESQVYKNHIWKSNIINLGTMNYTWKFMIVGYDDKGRPVINGLYQMVSLITISSNPI